MAGTFALHPHPKHTPHIFPYHLQITQLDYYLTTLSSHPSCITYFLCNCMALPPEASYEKNEMDNINVWKGGLGCPWHAWRQLTRKAKRSTIKLIHHLVNTNWKITLFQHFWQQRSQPPTNYIKCRPQLPNIAQNFPPIHSFSSQDTTTCLATL